MHKLFQLHFDAEFPEPAEVSPEMLELAKAVSAKLHLPLPPINSPLLAIGETPLATLSSYGYTNARANQTAYTTAGVTLASLHLIQREFEIWRDLPNWIEPPGAQHVARSLALAEACFERSLGSLARYHRLPKRLSP